MRATPTLAEPAPPPSTTPPRATPAAPPRAANDAPGPGPGAGVVLGVDTHTDTHVGAVLDAQGRLLGTYAAPATAAGYGELLAWAREHGPVARAGVECTGSYGAGLTRHLADAGVEVLEVGHTDRARRAGRRRVKNDHADAERAARAVLAGEATARPKARTGPVEAIRVLSVARRSAIHARTQAANQLRALLVAAPECLRAPLHGLSLKRCVAGCHALAVDPAASWADPLAATTRALRVLATRWLALAAEVAELDVGLRALTHAAAPRLLARPGVGPQTAAALLATAGDNPERLASEAALAALCGVSPVEASSGRVVRHRLNRGGDRQANSALWIILLARLRTDARTKAYVERRTREGRSLKEIVRCLKRYLVRELYPLLIADLRTATATPASPP